MTFLPCNTKEFPSLMLRNLYYFHDYILNITQLKLTSLFVSKYEVNPLVNLAGDKLALQRLAVHADKLVSVRSPRRELDVFDGGAVLQFTQPERNN